MLLFGVRIQTKVDARHAGSRELPAHAYPIRILDDCPRLPQRCCIVAMSWIRCCLAVRFTVRTQDGKANGIILVHLRQTTPIQG